MSPHCDQDYLTAAVELIVSLEQTNTATSGASLFPEVFMGSCHDIHG
ncbi:hypothetical protein COMA1_40052 [Candidatus Nitrospira nitrosa]|uniref:Uncharacterized protein n=1 Tax=Candidatus Nitrospira nitrosa TaxID=1742972 RepID=A0A0S4LKH8_9BACT|nr:hypothetical protein COMA1_40052 [Candidatus Nitrospira nitrosa]